jgi:hypothetical protein
LHFNGAEDSDSVAEKTTGLKSGRLARPVNVLSLQFAKPMRTWFVATAKLKQPIRTAIIEDDPALRKMIVSLLHRRRDHRRGEYEPAQPEQVERSQILRAEIVAVVRDRHVERRSF